MRRLLRPCQGSSHSLVRRRTHTTRVPSTRSDGTSWLQRRSARPGVGCGWLRGNGASGHRSRAELRRPSALLGRRELRRLGSQERRRRQGPAAGFTYGTCESSGVNGGCAAPLQIQIQPLCAYLGTVAATPIWKRCKIRGAPVGTIDNAPVMFTNRVQIKVYRGQGSDAGLALRALRALRSVNSVPPVVDLGDPIPPAPRGVLTGAQPCPRAGSSADIGRD